MSLLGVDLGTAYVRAARAGGGAPALLALSDGAPALPAVVAYAGGAVRVGRAAVEKAAIHPEATVRGVKRILGRAADDPIVARVARYATYQVAPREGGGIALDVDGELREPEDVVAAILAHVADAAATIAGERPAGAVLTAPYHAGDRQRRALVEAARRAGLPAGQILSEGTAIALSLAGAERAQRRIAIADVGAGGITVSVLETGPARVILLGCAGDPVGGGDDIDRGLLAAVLEGLHARWGDFPDPPAVHEMLRQTCEAMKRDLGEIAEVRAVIPFLPVGRRGVRREEVRVDRTHFEPLLDDTRLRLEVAARAALTQAQIGPSQLAAVYAAGGLTRAPVVRAHIERVLGPIRAQHHDPEGAVALGAAIQASMLSGAIEAIPVVDVQSATMPPPPMAPSIPPAEVRTAPPPDPGDARAGELRLEVATLLASVRAGAMTEAGPAKPLQRRVRANEAVDADDLADPERRADMAERLRAVWGQLGLALLSARPYGWDHPHTTRHLEAALREIERALEAAPRSVRFDVTPTSFVYDRKAVYQPDHAPFDRVPRQLFADGLRTVQYKPGIDAGELRAFLSVVLAAAVGFAADEDAVAALWDLRLTKIAHVAVDALEETDAAQLARDGEALAAELVQACELDDRGALGAGLHGRREAVDHALAPALPAAALEELRARAQVAPDACAARRCAYFPDAYREAQRGGDAAALDAALAGFAAQRVEAGDPDGLFAAVAELAAAFEAREGAGAAAPAERELTRVMLPPDRLRALLARLGEAHVAPATAQALARALVLAGDASLHDAARAAYWSGAGPLREALLPCLLQAGAGHERALGEIVRDGDVAHGLAALKRLAALATAPARAALHLAFESRHIELRAAAITHLPEASAETVRAELTRLFEDPEPAVRLRALAAVGQLEAAAAGPILVRRIHGGALGRLPVAEQRLLLETLARLSPRRAEAIAVELLGETHLIPSHAADETRVVAAELLGAIGGRDALDALVHTIRQRFRSGAALRDAARAAAEAVAARLGVRLEERP